MGSPGSYLVDGCATRRGEALLVPLCETRESGANRPGASPSVRRLTTGVAAVFGPVRVKAALPARFSALLRDPPNGCAEQPRLPASPRRLSPACEVMPTSKTPLCEVRSGASGSAERAAPFPANRASASRPLSWSARSINRCMVSAVTGAPLHRWKWRLSRMARSASNSASTAASAAGASAAFRSAARTHSLTGWSPATV